MNLTIWLDAELGFYHIVQQDDRLFQVRAHLLEGIQEIRELAQVEAEIVETPDSTFAYGLNLAPDEFLRLMARLTEACEPRADPALRALRPMPAGFGSKLPVLA